MAKKNYAKYLPKAGSTLAVAVAMTVALSNPVNATELDENDLQNNGKSLENGQNTDANQNLNGTQLKENNEAVEQQNDAVVDANDEKINSNENIIDGNQAALSQNAQNNSDFQLPEGTTAPNASNVGSADASGVLEGAPETPDVEVPDAPGASDEPVIDVTKPDPNDAPEMSDELQNPNLPDVPTVPGAPDLPEVPEKPDASELPDVPSVPDASGIPEKPVAPEAPDTEGMGVDEHNAAAGAYNDKVDEYNGKAEDYNGAVEEYNKDVGEFNEGAGKYNDAAEGYNEKADEYNTAVDNYNTEADKYNEAAGKYEDNMADYLEKAEDYNEKAAEYNTAAGTYNDAVDSYNAAVGEYSTEADSYNDQVDDYTEKVNQYKQDVTDYNAAVEAYNQQVEVYNQAATAYNTAVVNYNTAAKQYYQTALNNYNQAVQDQAKDKALYDAAAAKYAADQAKLEADEASKNTYLTKKEAYDTASEAYETARKEYEDSLASGDVDENKKKAFEDAKKAYDQEHQNYQAAVKTYNESLSTYDTIEDEAFLAYLNETEAGREYLENMETFNTALAQFNTDIGNYQTYLADKAVYDARYADYLEELYKTNLANKTQADKKQEIIDDVTEYNETVQTYNDGVKNLNDALNEGLDGVAGDVGELGEANDALNSQESLAATLEILNQYDGKLATLQSEAATLEADTRKNAELGSAKYAEYLAAVEAYNDKVEAFNDWVRETYNKAVADYNAAVDAYVPPTIPSPPSTGNGTNQSGTGIDWGNIYMEEGTTVNHIDVKYQAASTLDAKKEDGVVTYSNVLSNYTVTGVYVNEAAANGGNSTDYGVTYDGDGSGEQTADTMELEKSSSYQEFGSDRSGISYQEVAPDALNQDKDYYIKTSYGYNGYQQIEYNSESGEWGYYSGFSHYKTWNSVTPGTETVYDQKTVAISPDAGTISFYVTMVDDQNTTHGINVSLNANSVYADNTYYKAQYKTFWPGQEPQESDKLNEFYTTDDENNPVYLPVVWLKVVDGKMVATTEDDPDAEKYYDISGQSVFLISALTCDGISNTNDGLLKVNGLDLVLSMQTMIEVHKGISPEKLAYKGYQEQTFKNLNETNTPGTNPGDGSGVDWEGDAPNYEGNAPIRQAAAAYNPGEYTPDQFTKPTEPTELTEITPLDSLEGWKSVVEFPDVEKVPEIKPLDESVKVNTIELIELDGLVEEVEPVETKKHVNTQMYIGTLGTLDKVGEAEKMDLREKPVTPPVDPNPDPQPNPTPVVLNDDGLVTIDDGAVPLADVPKTGDASVVFGAMSAFSGFGLAFLQLFGRKKKEEN